MCHYIEQYRAFTIIKNNFPAYVLDNQLTQCLKFNMKKNKVYESCFIIEIRKKNIWIEYLTEKHHKFNR